MDCLKNHLEKFLKVNDLNNIVNDYLIGDNTKMQNGDLNYCINLNANLYGIDLFITEPLLDQLCIGGHILLVKKYIDCCILIDKSIINEGFEVACSYGHLELAQYLIDQGADNLNIGLEEACSYGHLELAQYLIDQGADTLNRGLLYACLNGHFKIVQYLIECGANNLNRGLWYACLNGHLEIIKYLIDQGADDFNDGIRVACKYGYLKIVQCLDEHKRKLNIMLDFNEGLAGACEFGHLEIVQFLVEQGADDLNKGMFQACQNGHLKLVEYLVECGGKLNIMLDIDRHINIAYRRGNSTVVKYLLSLSF